MVVGVTVRSTVDSVLFPIIIRVFSKGPIHQSMPEQRVLPQLYGVWTCQRESTIHVSRQVRRVVDDVD